MSEATTSATALSLDAASIDGAMAWWREAGLTYDFADQPQDWRAEPVIAPSPATETKALPGSAPATLPAVPAAPAPPPELPQTLEMFQQWWLAEPSLAPGPLAARVPPRGPSGAALMFVVAEPEAEDREALLSGPQGKLLTAMLAAMGIAPAETYFASVLPRHLPGADWADIRYGGMGAVLAQHIALVRPARVIALGSHVSALLGHNPAQNAVILRSFNHEAPQADTQLAVLHVRDLATLMARGRARAEFWRTWLNWSG